MAELRQRRRRHAILTSRPDRSRERRAFARCMDLSDRRGRRCQSGGVGFTAFEATPLMIDGMVFLSTPYNRVIALDPQTGRERWRYDPNIDRTRLLAIVTSRGVSTWLDPVPRADGVCRRRIFVGTVDARLIAV